MMVAMDNDLHEAIADRLRETIPDPVLEAIGPEGFQEALTRVCSAMETRVGERLSEGLSDAELEEFSDLADSVADEEVTAWLQLHRPDYEDVIMDVIVELIDEVALQLTRAFVTYSAGTDQEPRTPDDGSQDH